MKKNRKTSQRKPPESQSPDLGKDGAESAEQRSRVKERRAAEADSAPFAVPTDSTGSMTVAVTRHAPFSEPGEWRYLACNVDTLDVGVFVDWRPDWEWLLGELERLKEAAFGGSGVPWANSTLVVLPTGKPPQYRFHLQFPQFHLFVGKQEEPSNKTPNVYASINAELLWHSGVTEAIAQVRSAINGLGGRVQWVQVSRCDLAADFHIPGGLTFDFLREHRVPAQLHMHPHLEGDQLETFYAGTGGAPLQLRIYDKLLEVTRNPLKTWMRDIWGVPEPRDIWRTEFQIRRQALREFGVDQVDDLIAKMGGIWEYLTGSWFSLRQQDNSNATRRTVLPCWRDVQAVGLRLGPACTVTRRRSDRAPVIERNFSQACGNLVSMAALLNLETCDELLAKFIPMLKSRWQARDLDRELLIRRIKFGREVGEQRETQSYTETILE